MYQYYATIIESLAGIDSMYPYYKQSFRTLMTFMALMEGTELSIFMFVSNMFLLAYIIKSLSSIQTQVNSIQTQVASLTDGFNREFCTVGKNLAGCATVQIEEGGGGLIFCQDGDLFLMTAAHVLIMMHDNFQLKFRAGGSKFSFHLEERFIHRNYVIDGNCDIGIARITEMVNIPPFLDTAAKETALINSTGVDGRRVVGFHRSCLLPGNIVEHFSTARALVFGSASKPGCSGSPMFDSMDRLIGIVNGSAKHRGRTHANS